MVTDRRENPERGEVKPRFVRRCYPSASFAHVPAPCWHEIDGLFLNFSVDSAAIAHAGCRRRRPVTRK